jgi:hypothetical protein
MEYLTAFSTVSAISGRSLVAGNGSPRPEAVLRGSQYEVRQWPDADRRLWMIERE